MNKKIFYISAACLTLMMGASSCKNEEADIFDQSAAVRLSDAKANYTALLCDKGGKWVMDYFANDAEHGYTYEMDFNTNGSVTMSAKNEFAGTTFKSETSLWQMISDDGPVLSFNSYNTLFHIFADPANIPTTSDINETGRGHEGDYEFIVMGYDEASSTLKLKGKKHGLAITLRRLPADNNAEAYFGKLDIMSSSLFNAKMPALILTAKDGKRYTVSNATNLIFKFVPEGGDAVSQTITRVGMITDYGFKLLKPFVGEDSTFSVQSFTKQSDGSLLCNDDNTSRITAPAFGTLFIDQSMTWQVDNEAITGVFATAYADIVSGCKAWSKTTFNYLQFGYDATTSQYMLFFKNGKYSGKMYLTTTKVDDTTVKFAFDNKYDNNGKSHYSKVPGFKEFIDALTATEFTLSSANVLLPTPLTLTSKANANDKIVVTIP